MNRALLLLAVGLLMAQVWFCGWWLAWKATTGFLIWSEPPGALVEWQDEEGTHELGTTPLVVAPEQVRGKVLSLKLGGNLQWIDLKSDGPLPGDWTERTFPSPRGVGDHLRAGGWGLLAVTAALVGLAANRRHTAAAGPAEPEEEPEAERVGPYRLLALLGEGTMGEVYRAQARGGPALALKVLSSAAAAQDGFRQRFRRELRIARKLDHPAIVRVLDGSQQEPLYLAMELVEGETLRARIERGAAPLEEALLLLRPVFEALEYAHGLHIVHRDLKPENVMVSATGQVKVADFGLARSHAAEASQTLAHLTQTGEALGTPAYMAPEQIMGEPCAASDQYAAGILAFELLTGRHPFPLRDVLLEHLTRDPPGVRELRPELPERLDPVLRRMLAKQPEQRYPSLAEAWQALEAAAT